MTKVNIAEAKAQFSRLVRKVMKLVPIESSAKSRKPGTAKGRVWTSPDFDATPEDFSKYA